MRTDRVDAHEKQNIAALAASGKSQRAIARATGRDNKTVAKVLKEPGVIATREEIEKQLAESFMDVAKRALCAIDDVKLDKSNARDLGILAGVCLDKSRIINGRSTSNIAVIMATAAIEAGKQWYVPEDSTDG